MSLKSSKICQIQLPLLAIEVHDLFLTLNFLMVLCLMHFSFNFYDIILMCLLGHFLFVVTFVVVSNGNTSWDFEIQYLAPEWCAEFLACLSVYAAVTFASRFQTRMRTVPLASSYCMLYKYFKVHMTKMSRNDLSTKLVHCLAFPFQKKKKKNKP